ncbi:hypothetical protein [Legionella erythra]|uniref:Uncharacterized protein n=1 Tax=Legionella erythra TaxID=448 RepID=A0A0W0TUH7_LEGER|nr:hypothetical protein [Legionella erythra]KTC99093.1 hypothetical protein Lery_0632 [Legionella erythra]
MTDETNAYRLILNLGIKENLIPRDLTQDQYQALHRRLSTINPDVIQAHWQCLAIAGDERAYVNLDQIDHRGATMGHYAAWSENISALMRIKKKSLALFYRQDAAGRNMAHYAMLSRNPRLQAFVCLHGTSLACLAIFLSKSGWHVHWIYDNEPRANAPDF